MKFTLGHTNINVCDLEKSLEFYKSALGLDCARRHKAADGSFELAFISDGSSSHMLELTWLRDKEGPYELGDNESHIAFSVDDYDAAHALHEKMGCICYENKGMGLYFIEDPDGYWLEIMPPRK
ncbi:MAG: VOC family protein [Defluviitaleaceae bacterium]|nr:VOC family protein [Defluviitaleaceae bacterium]MCL2836808.1 VOC family protein [Defluviitaleaceae bacterium]